MQITETSVIFAVINNLIKIPAMEKYINPYTDFGFKKLFGSELNKELLIGFLNALFEEAKQLPDDRILDVKYLNNEQLGRSPYDRKAVFDVLCETEKGAKFHLEMQNVFQEFLLVNLYTEL